MWSLVFVVRVDGAQVSAVFMCICEFFPMHSDDAGCAVRSCGAGFSVLSCRAGFAVRSFDAGFRRWMFVFWF